MIKSKSALIIVSSLLLCVLSGLLTYFGLSSVGLVDAGKQPLVIELTETSKVYDGTELMPSGYKIVEGAISDNHMLVVEYESSQTYVGNSVITGQVKVLDQNQNDVTGDYAITCKSTTVRVTKRPIKIAPLETSKIYDGSPITGDDFEILEGSLAVGDSLSPTFNVLESSNTVGDYTCSVEAKIYNSAGYDVTNNYDIQTEKSVIKIDKKPIVITTDSVSKVYDLKNNLEVLTSHISDGSLNIGHYYEPKFKPIDQTEVGTYAVELESVVIYDENGNDVSSNYAIVFDNSGKLTIEKFELEIITESNSFKYDGQEHFDEGFTVNQVHNIFLEENLIEVKVDTYAKITDVGQMSNVLSFKLYDKMGTDITNNFIIDVKYGTLIVSDADVTIRVLDQNKVFDNENIELRQDDYQIIGPSKDAFISLLNDDAKDLDIKLYLVGDEDNNGIKDAGDYVIYAEVLGNLQSNFKIDIIAGKYTVSPAEVILTVSDSFEKEYDGTSDYDFNSIMNSYTISGSGEDYFNSLGQINIDLSTIDEAIDAGKYAVTAKVDLESNNNVYVVVKDGLLTINKKDLTVGIQTNDLVYNGEKVIFDKSTLGVNWNINVTNGEVYDRDKHLLEVVVECLNNSLVTPINVGTYDVRIASHNTELDKNYVVTYGESNSFEITKAPLSIKPVDKNKVYDCEEVQYKFGDFEVTAGTLYERDATYLYGTALFEYSSECPINVGTYGVSIDSTNENLEKNYTVTTLQGTLEITKRDISISPIQNATHVYNGAEFEYNSTQFRVVKGEILSRDLGLLEVGVIYNGDALLKPINVNTYTISINSTNGSLDENYNISYVEPQTLEIKKAQVKIGAIQLKDKVYDGNSFAYDLSKYEVLLGTIAEADKELLLVNVTYNGSFEKPIDAGTYNVKIDSTNGALDANYDITFGAATSFEITKAPLMIAPVTLEDKVYNAEKYVYDETRFQVIKGEIYTRDQGLLRVNVAYNGLNENPVNAGIYNIDIVSHSNELNKNYIVTYDSSTTLTITKAPLSIRPINLDDKVYDGKEVSYDSSEYEVVSGTIFKSDYNSLEVNVSYNGVFENPKNVGTYTVSIDSTNGALDSNYTVTCDDSTDFEISRASLTISPIDLDDKVYDGIETVYDNSSFVIESGEIYNGDLGLLEVNVLFNGLLELPVNVGTYAISINSTNGALEANYDITFGAATSFEITKRDVTIKLEDKLANPYKNDVYAFDKNAYSIVGGSLADAETFAINSFISGLEVKNVGIYDIEVEDYTISNGMESVNDNYNVSFENGKFEIVAKEVSLDLTVDAASLTKEYNGEEQFIEQSNLRVSSSDIYDADLSDLYYVVQYRNSLGNIVNPTNAGKYTVEVIGLSKELSNYSFDYSTTVEMEITDKVYNATYKNFTTMYTGTSVEIDIDSILEETDGLIAGHRIASILADKTADGYDTKQQVKPVLTSYDTLKYTFNNITPTIIDAKGNDVTSNYKELTGKSFEANYISGGRLIQFATNPLEKVYDGTAFKLAYLTEDNEGNDLYVPYFDLKVVQADQLPSSCFYYISDIDGNSNGLTTFDGLEIYEGEKEANYDDGGLYTNFEITIFTYDDKGSMVDVTELFAINDDEDLSIHQLIHKAQVIINANSLVTIYTGEEVQTDDLSYSVSGESSQLFIQELKDEGIEITLEIDNSYSGDAGTYTIDATCDELINFNVEYVPGKLTVKAANILVTVGSVSKVYDGEEYQGSFPYTVSGDSLAAFKDECTVEIDTNAETNVGVYDIEPDIANDSNNYIVNYVPGTLIITKADIIVTGANIVKTYDGESVDLSTAYTVSGLNASLYEGTITVDYDEDTNVGTHEIRIDASEDENFNVKTYNGTLTITKADIVFTGANIVKTYDGEAIDLTNAYTVSGTNASLYDGLITVECDEDTNVGTHEIRIEASEDENFNVKTYNGTLVINKADLVISALNITKTYDGEAIDVSQSYTLTGNGATHYNGAISVDCDDTTNVGVHTLTVDYAEDDNYNIKANSGLLVINKATLTISLGTYIIDLDQDDDGVVDDTVEVTQNDMEINCYNDYDDIESLITFSLSISAAGTYTVVPSIPASDLDNYNINIIPGYVVAHM